MHEVLLAGSAQLVDCPHLLQDGQSCPAQYPRVGENPSRGEGQLKKNALNSNMETYWEPIFMP